MVRWSESTGENIFVFVNAAGKLPTSALEKDKRTHPMGNTTLQLQSSNMPFVSPRIFGCEWELCEASDAGGYLSEENTIQVDTYWFQDSRTLGGIIVV